MHASQRTSVSILIGRPPTNGFGLCPSKIGQHQLREVRKITVGSDLGWDWTDPEVPNRQHPARIPVSAFGRIAT